MTYTKTQKGEIYCICSKYKRFKCCSRHSYLEKELEDYILEDLRNISQKSLDKDRLYKQAQQKFIQSSNNRDIDKEINAINIKISSIKKDIKSLYEDKLKGILTEQDFIDLSQDYNREREQLISKLSSLNNKKEEIEKPKENDDKLLKLINNLVEFKKVTNTILVKLIDRVEVSEDKKVTIYYRFKKPF
jgi:hypothetical protein